MVSYQNHPGPWAQHVPPALDPAETALVNAQPPGQRPAFAARLRRVKTFAGETSLDAPFEPHEMAERAEIILASVALPYDYAGGTGLAPGFAAGDLQIDNMVREFVALSDELGRFTGI